MDNSLINAFLQVGNKMSLKKLEIKMGIHHQELGLPWDKPVPEDMMRRNKEKTYGQL